MRIYLNQLKMKEEFYMSDKIKKSIQNLEAANKKLIEYTALPVENDRDRSGIIKAFEFTFELAWKTLKKAAQDEGLNPGGPKSSLEAAFQMDLISNDQETTWLQMLEDRNLLSHTYREELSKDVVERINQEFKPSLQKIIKKLKSKY